MYNNIYKRQKLVKRLRFIVRWKNKNVKHYIRLLKLHWKIQQAYLSLKY